jgi:hypothetical protein
MARIHADCHTKAPSHSNPVDQKKCAIRNPFEFVCAFLEDCQPLTNAGSTFRKYHQIHQPSQPQT